jgi:hypothetical protein
VQRHATLLLYAILYSYLHIFYSILVFYSCFAHSTLPLLQKKIRALRMLYSYFQLVSILEKRHGTLRLKKKINNKKIIYWGGRRGRERERARVREQVTQRWRQEAEERRRRERENEGGRERARERGKKKGSSAHTAFVILYSHFALTALMLYSCFIHALLIPSIYSCFIHALLIPSIACLRFACRAP